jgi:ATP-binding protein involved in chromosome partitioning
VNITCTGFFPDLEVEASVIPLKKDQERDPQHRKTLPGVKNVIAVASGKGGVGKSTITANLAAGLAKRGNKVGLVDADIYGPSIHIMFDIRDLKPGVKEENGKHIMMPVESHGVKIMTIGFFADINQAVAWRGPMASKALTQMFKDVEWGELDYLFVDLPPGTGDIHLSLVQHIPITAAIVVSTPQEIALADAKKGISFFKIPTVNVPIMGLVENMAWFTPDELPNNKYYIFGKDGVQNLATEMKVPLIGQIPLVQSIRESGDAGRPVVLQETTPQAIAFDELVSNVLESSKIALDPIAT